METMLKIADEIEKYDKIIIQRHVNPDPDALGSQLGLKTIIKGFYPEKEVYAVGKESILPEIFEPMDVIDESTYKDALVIVLDTANVERICMGEHIEKGSKLIKIDHHPDREKFGDISFVDTSYASTSEMIIDIINVANKYGYQWRESKKSDEYLYAGIVGDTGRFMYENTTSKTLMRAAHLLRYGVNIKKIYESMYRQSNKIAKLKGYVYSIYKPLSINDNRILHFHLFEDELKRFGVTASEAANLIYLLGEIEGTEMWACFIESDGQVRVRLRSREIPINDVAIEFGGGGHPLASGLIIDNIDKMKDVINAMAKKLN